MNERQKEQRELALERSDWICPVCGLPLDTYGSKQYAHRIAQTKENYSKLQSHVNYLNTKLKEIDMIIDSIEG